jgi:tellurite resistance protein
MMPATTVQEAMIYLMVITSASDRDMTDDELARIGEVVRTWPVFQDFDEEKLIATAQACQKLLHEEKGLDGILVLAGEVIPDRLHDTAYAAAVEVAAVDLEMRMEELRVIQKLRQHLGLDAETARAIERAAKARHRTLT